MYDNENYAEKAATFKAGQRVPDLSEKLGLFQDISSVKIACADRFDGLDADNNGSLSRSEYRKMK